MRKPVSTGRAETKRRLMWNATIIGAASLLSHCLSTEVSPARAAFTNQPNTIDAQIADLDKQLAFRALAPGHGVVLEWVTFAQRLGAQKCGVCQPEFPRGATVRPG